MALFRPRTRWDRLRLREKKFIVTIHSFSTRSRDFKKIAKKIEKIRKHQYGFFSSQNGTGEAENMEKKKFSFWSIPTQPGIENSKKIAKKLKKLKKHHYGFFSSQNGTGEVGNVRKKKLSFRSIQTWLGIGNSKKIAKIFKKLKNINMAFFQAKTGRERLRMWEKKNSHSDPF